MVVPVWSDSRVLREECSTLSPLPHLPSQPSSARIPSLLWELAFLPLGEDLLDSSLVSRCAHLRQVHKRIFRTGALQGSGCNILWTTRQ